MFDIVCMFVLDKGIIGNVLFVVVLYNLGFKVGVMVVVDFLLLFEV